MKAQPKNLGSLLSSIYAELGIQERMVLAELARSWPKIFDAPVCLHTSPSDLKNGVLTITVDSPVWLHQLGYLKNSIVKKLSDHGVNSVKFKHGRIPGKRSEVPEGVSTKTAPTKALTADQKLWMDDTVAAIDDPEVRESVKKAIERALSRQV